MSIIIITINVWHSDVRDFIPFVNTPMFVNTAVSANWGEYIVYNIGISVLERVYRKGKDVLSRGWQSTEEEKKLFH